MKYAITLWGSDPDLENDDAWQTIPVAQTTEAEALKFFKNVSLAEIGSGNSDDEAIVFITLDEVSADENYTEIAKRRVNKDHKPVEDGLWESEQRWESRMLYGQDIYS